MLGFKKKAVEVPTAPPEESSEAVGPIPIMVYTIAVFSDKSTRANFAWHPDLATEHKLTKFMEMLTKPNELYVNFISKKFFKNAVDNDDVDKAKAVMKALKEDHDSKAPWIKPSQVVTHLVHREEED